MLSFLKPFWLDIVKWGGIILGVGAVLFSARQSGRNAERVDQVKRERDDANEIIRQDRIVNSGNANSMRNKLSQALKRKRRS